MVHAARRAGCQVVGLVERADEAGWADGAGLFDDEVAHGLGADPAGKPTLENRLIEAAGDAAGSLAASLPSVRRTYCDHVVLTNAAQNGVIGAVVIIPGADMPAMTANQIRMVLKIAHAYGEELGLDRSIELLSIVGTGFVLRTLTRQALDFVPGFGWAVKGAVGFSGTIALGQAAIAYFEAGAPLRVSRMQRINRQVEKRRLPGSPGRYGDWPPDEVARLLARVTRPGRYVGGEFNTRVKAGARPRIVLSYPDVYEIGVSNPALQILYSHLNDATPAFAERAYCPWPDMADLMRAAGVPLWTLETFAPVAGCDLWGFTLPHELCYANVLEMLDLAGVPLRAAERDGDDPIVLGGGPAVANPWPVAPFFDAFFIGEVGAPAGRDRRRPGSRRPRGSSRGARSRPRGVDARRGRAGLPGDRCSPASRPVSRCCGPSCPFSRPFMTAPSSR